MLDFFDIIRDFLERGGTVLWVIFGTTLFLWTLIYERFVFYRSELPVRMSEKVNEWAKRKDKSSWSAHRIREAMREGGLVPPMGGEGGNGMPDAGEPPIKFEVVYDEILNPSCGNQFSGSHWICM